MLLSALVISHHFVWPEFPLGFLAEEEHSTSAVDGFVASAQAVEEDEPEEHEQEDFGHEGGSEDAAAEVADRPSRLRSRSLNRARIDQGELAKQITVAALSEAREVISRFVDLLQERRFRVDDAVGPEQAM